MHRAGETFERRYEAELVLIELFALLVLLFLLSSGAPNPVSHSAAPPAAQPVAAPAPAKPVEQPVAAPAKPAARHVARRWRAVVRIPDDKMAALGPSPALQAALLAEASKQL